MKSNNNSQSQSNSNSNSDSNSDYESQTHSIIESEDTDIESIDDDQNKIKMLKNLKYDFESYEIVTGLSEQENPLYSFHATLNGKKVLMNNGEYFLTDTIYLSERMIGDVKKLNKNGNGLKQLRLDSNKRGSYAKGCLIA